MTIRDQVKRGDSYREEKIGEKRIRNLIKDVKNNRSDKHGMEQINKERQLEKER